MAYYYGEKLRKTYFYDSVNNVSHWYDVTNGQIGWVNGRTGGEAFGMFGAILLICCVFVFIMICVSQASKNQEVDDGFTPMDGQVYVETQVVYEQPAYPVYEQPPQPVYEQPQPVYEQPVYEQPQPVYEQPQVVYEETIEVAYEQPPQVFCDNGHLCALIYGNPYPDMPDIACNQCGNELPPETGLYHCEDCQFDVCGPCGDSRIL